MQVCQHEVMVSKGGALRLQQRQRAFLTTADALVRDAELAAMQNEIEMPAA